MRDWLCDYADGDGWVDGDLLNTMSAHKDYMTNTNNTIDEQPSPQF